MVDLSKIKFGFDKPTKGLNGAYYYLYKITNLVNKKIYIGMATFNGSDLNKDKYIGCGMYRGRNGQLRKCDRLNNSHLYNSFVKYGLDNFKKEFLKFF